MVFYVVLVTFLVSLLMINFTSTAINDWNLDEIHVN